MKIICSVQGDTTVLSVAGEFTGELVPKFQQAVTEGFNAGRRDFLLDLSEAKALDSTALESLTALHRQTEEQLGMLRICVTDAVLRKVFEVTRLDQQLTIDSNLDDAIAGFGGAFAGAGSASRGGRP